MGIFRDILTGLVGAVIGGVLLHALEHRGHTSPSFFVELLVAFVGAVILLLIEKALMRNSYGRRI